MNIYQLTTCLSEELMGSAINVFSSSRVNIWPNSSYLPHYFSHTRVISRLPGGPAKVSTLQFRFLRFLLKALLAQ